MVINVQDYAVGWFALSLINANIAQIKGANGLLFWIISLVFGPVITFVLMFIKKDKNYK